MDNPPQSPRPLWRRPAALGLLGVIFMVAGWNLSTWRPEFSSRGPAHDPRFQQIRGMSEDPELNSRLDRMQNDARPAAKFELPGRIILLGGMALFVIAAYRMYREPPGPPPDEMPEPDPYDSRSGSHDE